MQAVILAAGKGTRLAHLTKEMPKPLISILGRPILDRIIASLPPQITDIFVITNYKEEQIHAYCAAHERGSSITCLSQGEMAGTYGALVSAASHLSAPFLVLNGDDIHSQNDLVRLLEHPRAFGVARRKSRGYHGIVADEAGNFSDMRSQTPEEQEQGMAIATGAYVLDADFFSLTPTKTYNGEYGIPHTLKTAKDAYPLPLVDMPDWVPINTPEDLKDAEKTLVSL